MSYGLWVVGCGLWVMSRGSALLLGQVMCIVSSW